MTGAYFGSQVRSRHWQAGENSIDNRFTCDRFRFRFVTDDDAVTQHVSADALDVLRRDVAAAVQESMSSRREREINRGGGRSAVANQAVEVQMVRGRSAPGPADVH